MSAANRSFEQFRSAPSVGGARRWFVGLIAASLWLFTLLPAAGAQSQARLLDAPRAAGTVGERYDGYAVVRGTPTPGISSLVDQVNADRRALYAQRAAADGVPVEAIGKIYAAEIIKSAPKGTWFLSESGQWTQK
ncbi:MAG: YdbL family protein [Rhodospirillaceae bacterium]